MTGSGRSPRWHDAAIIVAILAILAIGVWALRTPDAVTPTEPPAAGGHGSPAT